MTNLISPREAMMTPRTMKETLPRVFMFGGCIPRVQVVISTATGVVACKISVPSFGDHHVHHIP